MAGSAIGSPCLASKMCDILPSAILSCGHKKSRVQHPYYQLLCLVLSTTVTPTCVAMLSASRWKGLRHTLLVLFSATILIGITMLAISSEINPIGVFFLVAGGLCLVGYLISVAAEHCLTHQNAEEAQAAPRRQNHNGDNATYEAPTYEEVVATGYLSDSAPTIWTITSSPGITQGEPPPYSVVIEPPAHGETVVEALSVSVEPGARRASETDLYSRLRLRLVLPPRLKRFVSDTHELKGSEERLERLEPLTPPPAYENMNIDEVFEGHFQPSKP
ncbi:Transmembrane protein [Ophiophagus hannah]|uniref:Transmembrane protein n=1 Tax=Ophiophagus hannah TaxID=8665 RepID=V8NJS4_OPHHA|nr:Transmembrane protein [Ophiophagus hannah]